MATATRRVSGAATVHETQSSTGSAMLAERLTSAGSRAVRYSLVLVLIWIGAMKFTAYEAEGISGFVANSPLMSWTYQVFSRQQASTLLGVVEVLIAILIAARPFSARLCLLGSVLAVGMFFTTISFLFSTPGVFEPTLGFPALAVLPGQFLIKDLVLLGAALSSAGEAIQALRATGRCRSSVNHPTTDQLSSEVGRANAKAVAREASQLALRPIP